jgi:hypothetical protein
MLAARSGYVDAVKLLVAAGADVNQNSVGDKTSPMLIAAINGHFDLAKWLLDQGANPNAAAANGVTPLYAALNVTWAPRALYPQPRAFNQQQITYLDFMKALLDKGADPNRRLTKKVWYSEYNFDLAGVDEVGATPFWRAAFAGDVPAMQLLFDHGADANISTMRPAGRRPLGDVGAARESKDVSGLAPIPLGGPGIPPLQAAPSCRRSRRRREHPVSHLEGRRCDEGQSRRADGRRHGERPRAARAAVAGSADAAREARFEEQPQVRVVLSHRKTGSTDCTVVLRDRKTGSTDCTVVLRDRKDRIHRLHR